MNTFPLTVKDLRAYLESKQPDEWVGYAQTSSNCPLALAWVWLHPNQVCAVLWQSARTLLIGEANSISLHWNLSDWQRFFVDEIDHGGLDTVTRERAELALAAALSRPLPMGGKENG